MWEAGRIAANVLHEEMERMEGKDSGESKYHYDEAKGLGYAIEMTFVDDEPPNTWPVEGSYTQEDYHLGRWNEAKIYEGLSIEFPHNMEELYRNRDIGHYNWHYQVEITENGESIEVDFKAANGYKAGFEAKNFCLGRKLTQEYCENAKVDLFMVGISSHYKKPWKRDLLTEDLLINVRSWENRAFYFKCEPLPDNLRQREKNLMTLLRGKKEEW